MNRLENEKDRAANDREADKSKRDEKERLDQEVDEQSEESFPASDAPSFTPNTSIAPPAEVDDETLSKKELFPMLPNSGS